MLKYLWHVLIQGHDWRVVKASASSIGTIHILSKCQKCHKTKVIGFPWSYERYSWEPTESIGIDDFLKKIKGK